MAGGPVDHTEVLKAVETLLGKDGELSSLEDVPKCSLMKASTETISRCTNLNILLETKSHHLLNRFIRVGGYRLLNSWLTDAKSSNNTPLLQLILLTLQKLPVKVDHLKQNNTAKLVKQLSKRTETEDLRKLASVLVDGWTATVRSQRVSASGRSPADKEQKKEEHKVQLQDVKEKSGDEEKKKEKAKAGGASRGQIESTGLETQTSSPVPAMKTPAAPVLKRPRANFTMGDARNWQVDLELRNKLIQAIDDLLKIRDSQIDWLKNFIDDVKAQEIVINTGKTASTAVAVASTVALFTPFAVFGAIGLAASGVGGVGFALGDFIANKIKNSNLEEELKRSRSAERKLSDLLEELNRAAERLSRQLGCTVDMARRLILYMKEIHDISVDKGDDFLHIGANGTSAVIKVCSTLPHLKRVADAMEFGYGFYNAAKITSAGNIAMVVEGGEEVYQLTGSVIGLASKGLAIVGSVVGVADVIYSWANDNPNLASAKVCLEKVKANKSDLTAMRKSFSVKFKDL